MINLSSLQLIIQELNSISYPDIEGLKINKACEDLANFIKEYTEVVEENDLLKSRIQLLEQCESHSQVNWRLNCEIFRLTSENNKLKKELEKLKGKSDV